MRLTRISFLALAWVLGPACGQSLVELPGPDTGARDAAWVDTRSDDGRPTDSTNPTTPDSSRPDAGVDRSPDIVVRDTVPGGDARDAAPSDATVDTAAVTDVRDAATTDVRDVPTIDVRDAATADGRDAPTIDVRDAPATDAADAGPLDGSDTNPANTDSSNL